MIERQFVNQEIKEFQIQEYVAHTLKKVGHSHTKVQRTPLGEKIIIFASRPGLVVGRGGANIKTLTKDLKNKFGLENPQIEISEVENIFLDAQIVAEMIANSLERFGTSKFKGVGHKMMSDVINAGAMGIEILISGKIPGARAKTWRFYQGYLKKCGDVAVTSVKVAYTTAELKTGTVGIKVKIMPPDTILPDKISLYKEEATEPQPKESKMAEEKKTKRKKKEENAIADMPEKANENKPKSDK